MHRCYPHYTLLKHSPTVLRAHKHRAASTPPLTAIPPRVSIMMVSALSMPLATQLRRPNFGASSCSRSRRQRPSAVWAWHGPLSDFDERERHILQLKAALQAAVQLEDYKQAARLRDQIKELEPITALRQKLEQAVMQERFQEAATLRDKLRELAKQRQPTMVQTSSCPVNSDTVTGGIRVTVSSFYLPLHSASEDHTWVYTVRIANEGSATVQLRGQLLLITDEEGEMRVVSCPEVAGEQPILEPGSSFTYQSACQLRTPVGNVEGHYEVWRECGGRWGQPFKALIAPTGLNTKDQVCTSDL